MGKTLIVFGDALSNKDPVESVYLTLCKSEIHLIPQKARVLFLAGLFTREIMNGGFEQFMTNSAGNFAFETLQSLKALKANISSALLQQAVDFFPDFVPTERAERIKCMNANNLWERPWLELSKEFWNQVHTDQNEPQELENLWMLSLEFIMENKNVLLAAESSDQTRA